MIRPFGLRDVLAIRALQQTGIWLDLYHFLIHRRSALATALIAPIPWRGTGLASYVWQAGEDVGGFVQMLKRHGGAEADLLFLAPALDSAQPRSEDAWRQLLTHCSKSAGEQGVRRLFASLPEGSRAALVLREYHGLSYREIADALDISPGTVMSRLNYARTKLLETLAPILEVK